MTDTMYEEKTEVTEEEITPDAEPKAAKPTPNWVIQQQVEKTGHWQDLDTTDKNGVVVHIRDTNHAASWLRRQRKPGMFRILRLTRMAEVKEVPTTVMKMVVE